MGQNNFFTKNSYLVPNVKEEKYIFLKTIMPSRKATRDFEKEIEEKNEIR